MRTSVSWPSISARVWGFLGPDRLCTDGASWQATGTMVSLAWLAQRDLDGYGTDKGGPCRNHFGVFLFV